MTPLMKKILWLDDQYDDLSPYLSTLRRTGLLVDKVRSVSDAVKKLRENPDYASVIFDIKVLPGDDEIWMNLDKKKREENPDFDSSLGLELLYSLFKPDEASVKLSPPIKLDPKKVIVFSVVVIDKAEEISRLGIPKMQIVYKSDSDLSTLPELVKKIVTKNL